MSNGGEGRAGADATRQTARLRARDSAIRRTRAMVVGVAAGAVALSGAFSVVAANAFKGRQSRAATATATPTATRADVGTSGRRVPGPDSVPPIANDPAPLQPPEQPPAQAPAAPAPQPEAPAPVPQTSGGS
jgi:hypothetical protein